MATFTSLSDFDGYVVPASGETIVLQIDNNYSYSYNFEFDFNVVSFSGEDGWGGGQTLIDDGICSFYNLVDNVYVTITIEIGPNTANTSCTGTTYATNDLGEILESYDFTQEAAVAPSRYYAQITGNANVTTNFKPYTVWSNNSYLRLEYNGDITTRNGGICPFFAGQSPWFCLVQDDLDRYDKKQYLNIGSSVYIGSGNSWNTDGYQNTTVITFQNSAITMVKGEQSYTGSFSGNIPNNNMGFFANYSNGLQMNFYELKVYGYGDVLLYDFVPDLSGTTKGIRDRVSDTFTAATNQSYISLVSLRTFEIDTTEMDASYSGTSTSVTVTADSDLAWTASTSDSWISITNPTGSGNGSFTVVVAESKSRSIRTGTVTVISNEGDELTISVSQELMPFLFSQKPLYRNGDSVVKMYRSGELIYLKVSPSPQYEAMLYYNGDALTGTSIGNRSYVTVASTDTSASFDVEMADQNTPWAISDGVSVLASGTGTTSNVSCTIYPTNPEFMSDIFYLRYKKDGDGDSRWQWTGEASYFQFTTE